MDLSNNQSNENETVEQLIRKLNEKGTKVKIVKEGESPAIARKSINAESPSKKNKKPKKTPSNADKENASVDPQVLKQQEQIV